MVDHVDYYSLPTAFRRASKCDFSRSQRQEQGAESAKSRPHGRTRHSRGSSHISGRCDNDERPAASTNGAGIAESAADVGWDTALRRWGAERPANDPLVVGARASAGAGSREPYIGQVPAQSARTTPKIERIREKLPRDGRPSLDSRRYGPLTKEALRFAHEEPCTLDVAYTYTRTGG